MTNKKIVHVDAFKIRMNLDLEFAICHERCLDHNYYAPKFYIPEDEIWIDFRFKDETDLVVRLETEEVEGTTAWERRESRKKLFLEKGPVPNYERGTKIENGLKLIRVDGAVVRKYFDPEFVQGGHEFVYDYVPKGEVWSDDLNDEAELPFIFHHEVLEREFMSKGWIYDNAHEVALTSERKMRREAGACYPGDAKYTAKKLTDYYV